MRKGMSPVIISILVCYAFTLFWPEVAGALSGDSTLPEGYRGKVRSRELNTLYAWYPSTADLYAISRDSDDGSEIKGTWYPDGYVTDYNCVGTVAPDMLSTTCLRFQAPDLKPGEPVIYARLRLISYRARFDSALRLRIRGIEPGVGALSQQNLPSRQPVTSASILWTIERRKDTGSDYGSPNIAGIINEIISHPGWSENDHTKAITLIVETDGTSQNGTGSITFADYSEQGGRSVGPILEVYPTIQETFIARPMIGRPTDRSVAINMISLTDIDIYAEYGATPGLYEHRTEPLVGQRSMEPVEIDIRDLQPNTRYHYRLRYRPVGKTAYVEGFEGSFHTQRARGYGFTFTIQADSHILSAIKDRNERAQRLYEITLDNVRDTKTDFHIDMGDFAEIDLYGGGKPPWLLDAITGYLYQREFLSRISHTVPFYLVLGNHEAETGWRRAKDDDSLEVTGTIARKRTIPNPFPNWFYSGNLDSLGCCGVREDYYAWEWGDALFVVLDPFWYTNTKPHARGTRYRQIFNGWDWTLGKAQYDWLYDVLHRSQARWKFVFSHHMTGGALAKKPRIGYYGWGGIDAAKFSVAHKPTFEWGGEDSAGEYVFDLKRPGWDHGPIHKIMASNGVDIFFHGHDHVFVREILDGVVYQACPQPQKADYSDGFYDPDYYSTGAKQNNSGYLRVRVTADSIRVDYVRSVLPEDEPLTEEDKVIYNGDVSYSYLLSK